MLHHLRAVVCQLPSFPMWCRVRTVRQIPSFRTWRPVCPRGKRSNVNGKDDPLPARSPPSKMDETRNEYTGHYFIGICFIHGADWYRLYWSFFNRPSSVNPPHQDLAYPIAHCPTMSTCLFAGNLMWTQLQEGPVIEGYPRLISDWFKL